jgi:hypothetical protein
VKIEKGKEEKASPQHVGQAKQTSPSVAIKTVEPSLPIVRPESSSKPPTTSASAELSHPRPVEKQKYDEYSQSIGRYLGMLRRQGEGKGEIRKNLDALIF